MFKKFRVLQSFVTLLFASNAYAALSPVGIAIVPPIQFPSEDVTITGIRGSVLWGKHRTVGGIDIGSIGNITSIHFTGLAVAGVFNWNQGTSTIVGLQAAGIGNFNINKTTIMGLQTAFFVNNNQAASTLVGLQLAAIANLSPFTDVYGVQVSAYNSAREVFGFQFGIINIAERLHGLQIGLVNIHKQGLFAICPLINFGF